MFEVVVERWRLLIVSYARRKLWTIAREEDARVCRFSLLFGEEQGGGSGVIGNVSDLSHCLCLIAWRRSSLRTTRDSGWLPRRCTTRSRRIRSPNQSLTRLYN